MIAIIIFYFDWMLAALLKLLDIISAPNVMMIYMIKG